MSPDLMKFKSFSIFLGAAAACSLLCGRAMCFGEASVVPSSDQAMGDFSLSGFGDKGRKSWEVSGRSADIGPEVIKLNDVVSNFYGDKETVKLTADNGDFNRIEGSMRLKDNVVVTTSSGAVMTTDSLDWDRKKQIVQTDAPVKLQKDEMVITGQGAKGFPDLNKVDLNKEVQVSITPVKEDQRGRSGRRIEITCDGPLQVDYQKNIATFNNNVRVELEDAIITGDQMELFFLGGSGGRKNDIDDVGAMAGSKIDRILARGNVTVIRGQNVSHSDEALYSALENKITLLGKPKLVIYSSEGLNAPAGN